MADLVDRDQEHLRLLHLCYYLHAGVTATLALIGLIYVLIGVLVTSAMMVQSGSGNADTQRVGVIIVVMGSIFVGVGLGVAVLTFLTGHYLQRRRHRTFCIVMAGLTCLWIPYGTVLGVCTIIVLNRPAVTEMFEPTRLS